MNNDGDIEEWHIAHFYHAPLAAVVTDITMFQNMIKNRESEVLAVLMKHITAAEFDFDEVAVKVIPKSNYVILGDSFKADVIVAAYSTTQNPKMDVGSALDTAGKSRDQWAVTNPVGEDRITIKDGVATYGYKPTSEGEITWGGIMKIRKAGTDEWEFHPFEHTFIAAKASAVVSPTKMNVFYRGAKNDVEVSAAGFANNNVDIQISNATKTGSGGAYIVKPGQGRECVVTVFGTKPDGSKVKIGEPRKFRVEPIPPATPKFATIAGSGATTKAQILASPKVTAKLENFLLNDESLKVNVTAFTMKVPVKGKYISFRGKSSKVTPQMKTALKNLRKGDVIIVDGIKTSTGGQPARGIKGNIIVTIK
ncbi:MAG: gliding motility-associated protein GldM [Halieaceae bacterium]